MIWTMMTNVLMNSDVRAKCRSDITRKRSMTGEILNEVYG